MIKRKSELKRLNSAAIAQEYLSGDNTLKELEDKYGVPLRTIQSWVRKYRKNQGIDAREISTMKEKELRAELARMKLKNELLEEIITLSEKQTGLSLRKKFGPKQ
ncbi:helix-turn-helix domain-containing protein [Peijinzhouia sedimentorum]